MEVRRGLLKTAIILITLFVQFGSGKPIPLRLSSGIEWSALLELRSSLGLRGKDWPIKAEPCRNWTGVHCENGRVVGINLTGLRRTRAGRLRPRFAVGSLANLPHLTSFSASGFLLNGSIPEWFGQRLRTLEKLDLRSCSLTGLIPSSLGELSALKSLLLSENGLTGEMPSTLGNLSGLAVLDLSNNSLTGAVPDSFSSLGNLTRLDLSSNFLAGSVPSYLGAISNLRSLNLSENDLTGRMPSTLGNLSGLSVLDLSRNSLTGPVPDSFSSLGNLTRLDLSSNFLSGSVPSYLGAISSLQSLNLSNNSLTASVPPQLGNLSKLVKLDLSRNSLSGSLPASLFSNLVDLQVLVLSGNAFDGALPGTRWSMPSLHFLDVSSNNLTGPLPKLASLYINTTGAIFNLSNNLFYGSLNTSSLNMFKIIDLSGNYLQGKVEVGGFSNVDLARNCLQMIPNQRDFDDCRMFYVQRSLPFSPPGAREPMQSPFPESGSRNNKRVIFIMAGILGGLGFVVLLVLVLVLVLKQCDNHNSVAIQRGTTNVGPVPQGESPTPPKDPVLVTGMEESFTYEQMLHLTGNFAEANIIKHGHSGDLFRGILEGGVTVVVKRVDLNLFKRESYIAELGLLSKVSHARLVPILGHCLENENEKCIVYKYMPNGDLATSLHRVTGSDGKLQSLDWITRWKIAIGAAEGLTYLHECSPPLVHRDVQASSILLDDKFEVRLGSLSEVTAQGDLHQSVITSLFSKPPYSDQGNSGSSSVTCAYDVYCFGKILLELVTGNVSVSKSDDAATRGWLEQTLSYISTYDKEQVTKIVDPSLIVDEDLLEEVWAMAIAARSCLNPKPSKRPPMRHVLKALENPLKVGRGENSSPVRLRTNSSRTSWSAAFFGSWKHSSLGSATATGHTNREGTSGLKQSGTAASRGSGGNDHSSSNKRSSNDHSSSNKRSSNEIFPEPLEERDLETGEGR